MAGMTAAPKSIPVRLGCARAHPHAPRGRACAPGADEDLRGCGAGGLPVPPRACQGPAAPQPPGQPKSLLSSPTGSRILGLGLTV